MKKGLYILMLEDNELDAELNQEQLHLLDEYNCTVKLVQDKENYLKAIEAYPPPDLVLCDYNLPQYNGLEALKDLNSHNLLVPFIFVTGTTQEEAVAGAIKAGAWDYVVKDRLFRLPLAIKNVLKLKKEKEASIEAEKKSQRLLKAIEETTAQIIMIDNNTNIEYVNKNFTIVTGYTPEEVLGQPVSNYFFKNENTEQTKDIQKVLDNKELFKGDIQNCKKNGAIYWEHLSITPIFNSQNILSYILIKEDITEKKKTETELIEALHKAELLNKIKEAFLQNVSHEIRTPLNAIVGFSGLLKSNAEKEPDIIENYTSIIEKSSHQLLSIVDDILTTANIHAGSSSIINSTFDVHGLLDHLYSIFFPIAATKNIALNYERQQESKPITIKTDKTKLTQILTNLLNNAIKYTSKGYVSYKYQIIENEILFYVKDSGIGIAKEKHEIIFDRFSQASPEIHINYGGSGLGLSISKSFAQMLGGKISLTSELNQGSEFILSLPYSSEKKLEPKNEDVQTLHIKKQLKVIVAEDETTNFLLLKSILEEINAHTIHARNGIEVIELFAEHPDTDLILMDIKMPGMNGLEATIKIKEQNKQVPIIAQTAYTMEEDKQKALYVGCNDFITKPIEYEELIKIIKKHLYI